MIERTARPLTRRVLLVDDELAHPTTAGGRAVRGLVNELGARGIETVEAFSCEDGQAVVVSDSAIHCVFINWTLGENNRQSHDEATELLRAVRSRNAKVPIFLMADRKVAGTITIEVATLADEFIWLLEDTGAFIAGRTQAAIERYLQGLLPPFAAALASYEREREYSWAAPGHQGGVAFLKSPVGRVFFDFYGENLFRTDMGIERGALGSLLGHTGPVGESERYAAKVFGAHRSYSVLNGTSGSNRAIMSACVGDEEIALCDRNCHKSIEQGLVLTGGIPVFLTPTRNRYGIIGPIAPEGLEPAAIKRSIAANPLAKNASHQRPVYAVVTNCTYDGMCYHAADAEARLAQSVDRVHFDEAWYGYARFNPMYLDRYAMRGNPAEHPKDGPTVFATHSTHKLLAALSQTSYIHIRDGRGAIDHGRFNEAYCCQASTSPLYALIASNDVAAAMMDGPGGQALTQDVIDEAVACRLAVARVRQEFLARKDWFFAPWNAEEVRDPKSGKRIPFHDVPAEQLATDPSYWVLRPGESWHGFERIAENWCMLDPIKFGIVCPGMKQNGQLDAQGIPADIVTAYLGRHGIVPSRTTDHMVLFLFSVGVTKGKWGTLLNTLLDFKSDYDRNAPLTDVLPNIVAAAPARYAGMGLKDLGAEMWEHMKKNRQGYWQAQAYATLPTPEMTPRRAFQQLMAGAAEKVPLDQMANRIVAVGVIPYPPGIPIVMPGENLGESDGPWLTYLRALREWGHRFPGFTKEVEGTEERDGTYYVYCLTAAARRPTAAEQGREPRAQFGDIFDPDFVAPPARRGSGPRRAPVPAGSSTSRKRNSG
ncbi:MAG TPA: Orn/Lys/Arg decarboxylase N-terminal domain-containing protein [Gemmatimonadales bacterium]|nr:Orn/Lys/Arg decarboxylase N-terminal domain-containing protein [Gemmatimonadales bacterium]